MTAQRKRFEINTEPHVAEIGEDSYEFQPEVYADELLDSWDKLRDGLKAASVLIGEVSEDATDDTVATRSKNAKAVMDANRELITELMLDESAARFREKKYPQRVITELIQWVLEVYGLRPTGPSNDSSESSPTETASSGESSTDDTLDEG